MTNDIYIHFLDLPGAVNECVTHNEDGSYTIIINEALSPAGRTEAYNHAMKHINGCDFEKYDVNDIELNAHE